MTLFQKGRYMAKVQEDGAIKVAAGDILGAYSMAIHGNPWTLWEFARVDRRKKLIAIANYDLIYAGETLYHLPTLEAYQKQRRVTRVSFTDGDVIEVKRKQPPRHMSDTDKKKAVKDFLQKRHKLSPETLGKIDSVLSRISDVAALVDLLSTLGLLGETAGAVGGIAGIPLFAISAGIAIYDANRFDRTLYEMLCVGYTYTAWAFNDPMPSQSKLFLSRTDFKWRMNEYHTCWRDTQTKVLTKLREEIRKMKLKEDDVKLAVRELIASKNKQLLFKKVIDNFAKEMKSKPPSHADAVRNLADYRYPE
jgi:hypothetical protein